MRKNCRLNITRAFSLVELMVVIAIIGLLAAVAAPAYRDFVYRTNVAKSIGIIQPTINKTIEYYNKNGIFPCANNVLPVIDQSFGNTGTCSGQIGDGYMDITDDTVTRINYNARSQNGYPNAALLFLVMDPDKVGSTQGQARLTFIISALSDGTIEVICGNWADGTGAYDTPTAYLPSACNNSSLNSYDAT